MAASGPVPVAVNIDAYSDVACPWCYVGKRRLDLAIQKIEGDAKSPSIRVVVKWHPYMIDLRTNISGEEYLAYNRRRWGSDSWTQSLRRSGAKNGLNFADWQWWPNTLHAHRLVHLADSFGKGAEAKQLLLEKTYEKGLNVSNVEVLCSIAEELDLPKPTEYLESDQGKEEVLKQDKFAKSKLGIGSVPHFIVDNKFSLSGAQDVATFESAIQKAATFHLEQLTSM
ncbi:unnamed protein product [Calypogeia fissa]